MAVLQKYLEDPIAEEILKGVLSEGDTMEVDYDKVADEIKIADKKGGENKKPKKKASNNPLW